MRLDPRSSPFLLLLCIACAGSDITVEGNPTIVGVIVARDLEGDLVVPTPNIHVKQSTDDCGIVFAIGAETRIEWPGGREPADSRNLSVGRTVAVWAPLVMDSCPGQAGALIIEVLH